MADAGGAPTDDELLDYVAGRADAATAARVEAAAAEDADLRAEIAVMRGARDALAPDPAEPEPGALGWARLERALDAEAAPSRRAAARGRAWQLTLTAVAAVVAWQFVALPAIQGLRPGTPGYEPVAGAPADGPVLTVAFAPETTEADLRALLRAVGAEVSGGPSALGLWRLRFAGPPERDAALERLAASPLVESVQAE